MLQGPILAMDSGFPLQSKNKTNAPTIGVGIGIWILIK